MNEGLTSNELKQLKEFLIKANTQQLSQIYTMVWDERIRRTPFGGTDGKQATN